MNKENKKKVEREREIHKTDLPTITFQKEKQNDMSSGESTFIKVSDETSSDALETFKEFKEIKKEIE